MAYRWLVPMWPNNRGQTEVYLGMGQWDILTFSYVEISCLRYGHTDMGCYVRTRKLWLTSIRQWTQQKTASPCAVMALMAALEPLREALCTRRLVPSERTKSCWYPGCMTHSKHDSLHTNFTEWIQYLRLHRRSIDEGMVRSVLKLIHNPKWM